MHPIFLSLDWLLYERGSTWIAIILECWLCLCLDSPLLLGYLSWGGGGGSCTHLVVPTSLYLLYKERMSLKCNCFSVNVPWIPIEDLLYMCIFILVDNVLSILAVERKSISSISFIQGEKRDLYQSSFSSFL